MNLKEKVQKKEIQLKPRTKSMKESSFQFDDLSTLHVQNVIWATGFYKDYSWIEVASLFDENGNIKHRRGVMEHDGLYFLGLPCSIIEVQLFY